MRFCADILGIGDEIPTYEQVTRLEPDTNLCRPIVLIGAPGVGRRTLIRKLINSDPSVYHPVVQRKLLWGLLLFCLFVFFWGGGGGGVKELDGGR